MKKLCSKQFGVTKLDAHELKTTNGGKNALIEGGKYLVALIALGWDGYCDENDCGPVTESGSVGLGNTPYHF